MINWKQTSEKFMAPSEARLALLKWLCSADQGVLADTIADATAVVLIRFNHSIDMGQAEVRVEKRSGESGPIAGGDPLRKLKELGFFLT